MSRGQKSRRSVGVIRKALGALTFLAALQQGAAAQSYKWTQDVGIADIEPATRGWIWVRLDQTIQCGNSPSAPIVGRLLMRDDPGFEIDDKAWQTMMTSMMMSQASNFPIRFRVTYDTSMSWCRINRTSLRY